MLRWLHRQPLGHAFEPNVADGFFGSRKSQKTTAVDSLPDITRVQGKSISWGLGKGGPVRYDVNVDRVLAILAYETGDPSWYQRAVERVSRDIPERGGGMNLAAYVSARGLRIGSSVAQVARVFGPVKLIQLADGFKAAYFERLTIPCAGCSPISFQSAFVFRAGYVTGISYAVGAV